MTLEILLAVLIAVSSGSASAPLDEAQLAVVKVYGAGGLAGLEGYQTGVFLSDEGAVLTIESPVLDAAELTVIDAYGDRHSGRLTATDESTGLAVLDCQVADGPPGSIEFRDGGTIQTAQTLRVLSNAFNIASGDEPVTVQRARLAAVGPIPVGRANRVRPQPGVPEPGTPVLILDAITSNPGSAGGIVIARGGAVVGVVGAECRSDSTGAWINYALPAEAVVAAIERMGDEGGRASEPIGRGPLFRWRPAVRDLGMAMLPSLLGRTPAYVESVDSGSPAGRAGLLADDLIVAVDGATVADVDSAGAAIARSRARRDSVELTLLRGREVVTVNLAGGAP